jgi:transposase
MQKNESKLNMHLILTRLRGYSTILITPILHQLIYLSALPVSGIENDFSIDSTGFRTTTFSAYEGEKYGRSKQHKWLKAHFCAGVKTNIIAAVSVTAGNSNDSPEFSPLIRQIATGFTIGGVTAYLAYSSRKNLEVVNEVGGKPYIPFKRNATAKARGSAIWKRMYHFFQLNREEFNDHFHKPSNIEATNAAVKRKFGETLKSKKLDCSN